MIKYVKFDDNGNCIGEAPFEVNKNGMLIRGYNKESNEAMLLEDGYVKYDGPKHWSKLTLDNGEIKEPVDNYKPNYPKQTFTKLQIRRAMRRLGVEEKLDRILGSNRRIFKDWQDATEISFQDEVFKEALQKNGIDQAFINNIIKNIVKE